MGLLDKVKGMFSKNSGKADAAIDKGGDVVDQKTGSKYEAQVDKGQDAGKDALDKITDSPPDAT
jgi:hypothetical protein